MPRGRPARSAALARCGAVLSCPWRLGSHRNGVSAPARRLLDAGTARRVHVAVPPDGFARTGDPVEGNPFSDKDRRHTVSADATREAEEEVGRINERASTRLAAGAPSRVLEATPHRRKLLKGFGEPPRTRTLNLEIKSLLLYQLS